MQPDLTEHVSFKYDVIKYDVIKYDVMKKHYIYVYNFGDQITSSSNEM